MSHRARYLRIFFALLALACAEDPRPAATSSHDHAPSPVPEGGERLPIDPARSSVVFVGRTPLRAQEGRFERLEGELRLVEGELSSLRGWVEVEMGSVSTLYPLLTRHLRSPDFFDATRYPRARFEARGIWELAQGGPESPTHRIDGRLELRGITRALQVPARIALDPTVLRVEARFAIDRQRFGVRHPGLAGEPLIEDEVALRVALTAPRPAPSRSPRRPPPPSRRPR